MSDEFNDASDLRDAFNNAFNVSNDPENSSDLWPYEWEAISDIIGSDDIILDPFDQSNFEPSNPETFPDLQGETDKNASPGVGSSRPKPESDVKPKPKRNLRKFKRQSISNLKQLIPSNPPPEDKVISDIAKSFSLITERASKKYKTKYSQGPPRTNSIIVTEEQRKTLVRKEWHEVLDIDKVEVTPYCDEFGNVTHTKLEPFNKAEYLTRTLEEHEHEFFTVRDKTYKVKTIKWISSVLLREPWNEKSEVCPLFRCCGQHCDTDRFDMRFPYNDKNKTTIVEGTTGRNDDRLDESAYRSTNYPIATECVDGTLYCSQCADYQRSRINSNTKSKRERQKKAAEVENDSIEAQTAGKRRKTSQSK